MCIHGRLLLCAIYLGVCAKERLPAEPATAIRKDYCCVGGFMEAEKERPALSRLLRPDELQLSEQLLLRSLLLPHEVDAKRSAKARPRAGGCGDHPAHLSQHHRGGQRRQDFCAYFGTKTTHGWQGDEQGTSKTNPRTSHLSNPSRDGALTT